MIKKLPHEANLLRAAVFVLLLYDRIRKIYIYTFEPYEIETHFCKSCVDCLFRK